MTNVAHSDANSPVENLTGLPKSTCIAGLSSHAQWRFSFQKQLVLPIVGILTVLCATNANAAFDDVIKPYIGYSVSYDDNLLRYSDYAISRSNLPSNEFSDVYHRLDGGFAFQKKISQQVLIANINVSRTSFNRFSALDNDGKDILAKWNWHIGNHLEGNIGQSYSETLTPFVEFHQNELNVRSQRRQFLDGSWRFHPSWRIRAGYTAYRLKYDLTSQKIGDRNEDTSEVGLDYIAPSNSTLGLQLRNIDAVFPNDNKPPLQHNNYNQHELKGKVDWWFSGKTRLQFLGGWVERTHEFAPERDFNGLNARAIGTWTPTGKLSFTLTTWREIGAVDDLITNYTLNQGASLGGTWALAAKLQADAQLKYETRDYSFANTLSTTLNNRKDTYQYASLNLTYMPTQHLQFGASLYRDLQRSNIASVGYRANGIVFNTRYEF